jgi:tetratricopeptide (TPR) repeat protein
MKSMFRVLPAVLLTGWLADSPTGQPDADFMFLTGLVLQLDGTPPHQPVGVDLACGGQVLLQVFSAENGSFRFEIGGQTAREWADASVGPEMTGGRGSPWNSSRDERGGTFGASKFKTFNLAGCEVRLSRAQELRSNSISLGSRSSFDSPDIGVIVILREESALGESAEADGGARGRIVSLNTLKAPAKAQRAYDTALRELSEDPPRNERALKGLKDAVAAFPEFAAAWHLMGETRTRLGDIEAAVEAFRRAIAAEPEWVDPYMGLARLHLYGEEWRDAADVTARVLELTPMLAQACYFNGLANFFLGRMDLAEASLSRLEEMGRVESYPIALFHLGVIHSQRGEIPLAATEFERYLALMPADQFPPGQKERIEAQLAAWERQGLTGSETP